MTPILFCPNGHYVGLKPSCSFCNWTRPDSLTSTEPGRPAWFATLGQPFMSRSVLWNRQLLLTYGARGGVTGGMVALGADDGREIWRYDVGACVEGGVALYEHLAIFGDENGRLHAVDLASKQAAWEPVRLEGGIRVAPLVDEVRAYTVTDRGMVVCVDARSGRVIGHYSLPAKRGFTRIASTPTSSARGILVSALDGGLYLFESRALSFELLYQTLAGIYTSPLVYQDQVIIATQAGDVISVALRNGQARQLCSFGKPVRATPLLANGMLYIPAQDHKLHVVEAATGKPLWEFAAEHSLISTPLLSHGLVVCSTNNGKVLAIEPPAQPGAQPKLAWSFDVEADLAGIDHYPAAVFGGFAADDDQVFFGAYNGRIYALPWHLGNYDWAAERAERAGQWLEASTYVVMSGGRDAEQRAAQKLSRGGLHIQAARMYEALNEQIEAAQEYEHAAGAERSPYYWECAARLWRALKRYDRERDCWRNAAQARNSPWLELSQVSFTEFKQDQVGIVKLRVSNAMPVKARNVYLELEGKHLSLCPKESCPELTLQFPWDCVCEQIKPLSAGTMSIEVVAEYTDEQRNPFTQRWSLQISVASDKAPINVAKMFTGETHITEVQGDVGLLKSNTGEAPDRSDIHVQGDVGQVKTG